MRRRKPTDLSPISQKIILVAAIFIALFALVFFIWRPIAPDLDNLGPNKPPMVPTTDSGK